MGFVEDFLKYTEDAESPTSYFRWAAYTTLAATLRDNVWIDLVLGKVYPNMYTMILSRRSSLVKKSTPLKTALRMMQEVDNTKIINGRATIAGIIGVLTDVKTDAEGNQVTGASGLLYSEEISSMFMEDHYATDTLTDWYDGHVKWGSHLSSTGSTQVNDICLSILGSSNEELIRSVYDQRAMQGGLLARTMLIVESKKRHKNSLMYAKPKKMLDGELIKHLRKVAKLKGEMRLEDAARRYYDEWYNNFSPLEENSSHTGVEGRIHTHALKLAIAKSVSERLDLIITKKHMEEAIIECLDLLPNYRMFVTGHSGPLQQVGRELILLLLESDNYTLTKANIMWSLWASGSDTVNKVLESLQEAGNIMGFINSTTGDYSIRLTTTFLERLTSKVEK